MGIFSFFKKGKMSPLQEAISKAPKQEAPVGRPASHQAPISQPPVKQEPVKPAPKQPEVVDVPYVIDGKSCAYQYEKVDIALFDGVDIEKTLGQRIQFDSACSPIELLVGDQRLGTIKNSKLADMVSDWFKRSDPVFAVVARTDDERHAVAIDLFLYRDQLKYMLKRHPDAKRYKLTGNRREEMQDNISCCKGGEECSIEYDFEKEKYLVISGFEIGYLPASAAKIVEEHGESNITAYIAEVSENDAGIYEVFVHVFPKGD